MHTAHRLFTLSSSRSTSLTSSTLTLSTQNASAIALQAYTLGVLVSTAFADGTSYSYPMIARVILPAFSFAAAFSATSSGSSTNSSLAHVGRLSDSKSTVESIDFIVHYVHFTRRLERHEHEHEHEYCLDGWSGGGPVGHDDRTDSARLPVCTLRARRRGPPCRTHHSVCSPLAV